MYRLYVLGQKLSVGSDDLFLPATVGVWNRCFFGPVNVLFVLMVLFGVLLDPCDEDLLPEQRVLAGLVAGFLFVTFGSLLVYALMLYVSTRGAPADGDRRKAMPALIVALLFIYLVEAGFAVAFTYVTATFPTSELPDDLSTLPVDQQSCAARLQQEFTLLCLGMGLIWFDVCTFSMSVYLFLHRYSPKKADTMHLDEFDRSTLEWERCFRYWCRIFRYLACNLFGYVGNGDEAEDTYRSVAEIFNVWFAGTGLTLTDLLTALLLVRMDQKSKVEDRLRYVPHAGTTSDFYEGKKTRKKPQNVLDTSFRALDIHPEEVSTSTVTPSVDPQLAGASALASKQTYQLFKRHYEFLPYVIGMYGWKLMIYRHMVRAEPFSALRKVLRMPTRKADVGHGDNCCRCSQHTLLQETGLDPDDVIYGNFDSVATKDPLKSTQVPHAVFVDHARRSVVVAMRGTLSLQDLMTDAMLEPESLVTAGRTWGFDGTGHYAHKGMLRVALRIRRILEKNQILHRMLKIEPKFFEYADVEDTAGYEAINVDYNSLPDCRDYDLVIVGHSLGAAAAAILTLCLRPTFPNATCLAYANPGAVFSYELAESSKEWCTNVWLGNDMVPHLNWQSVLNLRIRTFDALWRCRVSKAQIFRASFLGRGTKDLFYEPYEVPSTPERDEIKAQLDAFRNSDKSQFLEQIPMFCPGVLIHMAKLETVYERHWCIFTRKKRVFEPHIVQDRKVMQDPVISTRSLFDHFPDLLPDAMAQIVERHSANFEDPVESY